MPSSPRSVDAFYCLSQRPTAVRREAAAVGRRDRRGKARSPRCVCRRPLWCSVGKLALPRPSDAATEAPVLPWWGRTFLSAQMGRSYQTTRTLKRSRPSALMEGGYNGCHSAFVTVAASHGRGNTGFSAFMSKPCAFPSCGFVVKFSGAFSTKRTEIATRAVAPADCDDGSGNVPHLGRPTEGACEGLANGKGCQTVTTESGSERQGVAILGRGAIMCPQLGSRRGRRGPELRASRRK